MVTDLIKPRILVVEDETIVARDIQLQLVELGYEPIGHATNSEQAILLAGKLLPDLVLMDIQLAGASDGIATAQTIRSQFNLPVIFLTAFAAEDILERAKLTEPFGYVLKPFSERELRTVIEMAIYRHKADAKLRESQAMSLSILNSVNAKIIVMDANGIIIAVNEPLGFAVEIGKSSNAITSKIGVGSNYLAYCASGEHFADNADAVAARKGIAEVLAGTLPHFNLEYAFPTQQEPRWFDMIVTPLGTEGKGVVVSHTDITERTLLEQQLRESQKIQAIGTLAGGIAHDFNNILAVMLGHAERAREELESHPKAISRLNEIQKAGMRASDLIGQILSFSRRQPTLRKPRSLVPIVEESIRLLRATLPARIALEFSAELSVPWVLVDVTQIQQIVINLTTNAMQAMNANPGLIEIHLDHVNPDAALFAAHPNLNAIFHQKGVENFVRLTVRDNGPGMDAKTVKRIFEPFFTTKKVDEGTGLGLSVVHGIVHAHEGAIEVESKLGVGTTFWVFFPAIREDNVNEEVAPPKEAAFSHNAKVGYGQKHILYLDDESKLVPLVKELLEMRGHKVSGFSLQSEALAALNRAPHSFDLVVCDYNMPGISGLEVARKVRALKPNLPVAIASGFIDDDLAKEAKTIGVCELISKVHAVKEICALLDRLENEKIQ